MLLASSLVDVRLEGHNIPTPAVLDVATRLSLPSPAWEEGATNGEI